MQERKAKRTPLTSAGSDNRESAYYGVILGETRQKFVVFANSNENIEYRE